MPKIEKQSNVPVKKKKVASVWDAVTPVTEHKSGGLHMSLYGRSKTGKTRLVSTFEKPVLIIGAEDGTKSISTVKGVDFVRIRHSEQVGELLEGVNDRGYATVAIDTVSRLADQILMELLGLDQIPEQKSWGLATREQYMQQGTQLRVLMRLALDLEQHVVMVAHERNFNEDTAHSDLLLPSIGSALPPQVTNWLNGAVDYICNTFIREQTITKLIKGPGGKQLKQTKPTGKAEFCLRVGPSPTFMTGFRVPEGQELPDVLVNPTFTDLEKLVKGTYKPIAAAATVAKPKGK